jgi:hypothetical protein
MKSVLSFSMVIALSSCGDSLPEPKTVQTESCVTDLDCKSEAKPVCVRHVCAPAPPDDTGGMGPFDPGVRPDGGTIAAGTTPACTADDDCGAGFICASGACVAGGGIDDGAPEPVDGGALESDGGAPASDGGAPPGACHPVVNELQATGVTASDEWVEIFNPCSTSIDLHDWTLLYRSAGNDNGGADLLDFTFTQSLAAGGYLVIAGSGYHGIKDGSLARGLAGGGGAVGLRDASGKLVDSVAYQTLTAASNFTEKSPAPNPPALSSIERLPNGADSDDNSRDFSLTSTPTPRAPNN